MSTIVLVHALGSSSRAWQPQVAALGERHKVIAPDLPGHGAEPGPFGLEPAAFAIADLIAHEPEPVHLVGISVGATVAMLAALDDPARIAGLVLSGGTAHAPGVALQRNLMRLMPTGLIAALMSGMYAGGRPDRKPQAAKDLRTAGKRAFTTGLTELAALDLRPELAGLDVPTLVLCGTKDKDNLKPAEELATTIPGAHLDTIPDAGHIWNLQFPDLFTAKLTEFIAQLATAQRAGSGVVGRPLPVRSRASIAARSARSFSRFNQRLYAMTSDSGRYLSPSITSAVASRSSVLLPGRSQVWQTSTTPP